MDATIARGPELISLSEAAQIASVSYWTLWRKVRTGELEAVRVGHTGVIRVRRADLDRFLFGEPS
jgi:excisionase family DNA binding protein